MPIKLAVLPILAALSSYAQWGGDQTRSANIRGGGGDGKCTIEIEVDGAADVEIRGTTARLRTLAGQRATWRRFECNQPMPTNPYDFRFKGIDGRGRQDLMRTPGNGGPAVIRIEDSRGGREGYTFDIFWRGGSDSRYRDSYNDRYDDRYDDRYNDRYDRRRRY